MPKRVVDLRTERPCLDIASFGRRGPEAKLTPSEVAFIARTARRVPEVMIKVSGGARTLQGVGAHFDYIGRKGLNEIETDMGERLMERGFEKDLMLDWDLDVDVLRRHTDRAIAHGRKPPKLVHNLIFSMPKGTPSDKLAAAVRAFAVDQFALQASLRDGIAHAPRQSARPPRRPSHQRTGRATQHPQSDTSRLEATVCCAFA